MFLANIVKISKLQVFVMEIRLSSYQEVLPQLPHAIGQVHNVEIWPVQMPQMSIILMPYVELS